MIETFGQADTLAADGSVLNTRCFALADVLIGDLRAELGPAVAAVEAELPADHRALLRHEYDQWASTDTWQLINASDPCGT
jgi:hypothetical protein